MASYEDEYAGGDGFLPNADVTYTDTSSLSEKDEPRILLMGQPRSGKSSIQRVVFHKMSPHETLFLEQTHEVHVKEVNNNALVHFQILDFPGGYVFEEGGGGGDGGAGGGGDGDANGGANGGAKAAGSPHEPDPNVVFCRGGAVVYVIDGQDDGTLYAEAAEHFTRIAMVAHRINPKIRFFVLIHKVDGDSYLSEDHKIDCQREIQSQVTDALADAGLNIHPNFHLTSIYDHTIFEAFSKIVQKLIPQLAFLENLLDSLISSCGIDKAFLFDVVSKVYVATDSNPVDMQTYELCSDMIDVVIDVSCIYSDTGDVSDALSSDASSGAAIKLSTGYYLYLKEVNRYLALVCLMRDESFAKSGLVEYNVAQFKKAIADLFAAKKNAAH